MQITSQVEHITPDFARKALQFNTKNRRIDNKTVNRFIGAILRDEWLLNGEAIIFDCNGNLLNGQHRLTAVIAAGKSITSVVVRGVQSGVFQTLDGGKKRSATDVLSLSGYKSSRTLSSAARAIVRLESGHSAFASITSTVIVQTVKDHPSLTAWVDLFRNSKAEKFLPASFVGAVCLASERHGEEKMTRFFSQVSDGIGLTEKDAALILRDRFITKSKNERFKDDVALAFCVKAINAYLTGAEIKRLLMRSEEAMPQLV